MLEISERICAGREKANYLLIGWLRLAYFGSGDGDEDWLVFDGEDEAVDDVPELWAESEDLTNRAEAAL